MSLLIGNKLVVSMHYKLTDDNGNLLDSSEGKEPLSYLHGAENIIPGLENELEGKGKGDSLQLKVEPAEGYGDIKQDLIQTFKREVFKDAEPIAVGMMFEAQAEDGAVQHMTVKEVDEKVVTIDANHPLAGIPLNFEVDIVGVREATEEELNHGHVH